ncbi:hypothetical protein KSP40_PGU021414 [Platanthera guangdongensis]|uniref:Uncharacterized protein n=1 Tax=Platanthera guangdongensis TaxID=2320717 RepID=A0ABR2MN27_9ASPA
MMEGQFKMHYMRLLESELFLKSSLMESIWVAPTTPLKLLKVESWQSFWVSPALTQMMNSDE